MFKVKEDLAVQLMHYDVTAGTYLQLDEPRPLELESLAMLIPGPTAEQVTHLCP
jgi:hypothetical protein